MHIILDLDETLIHSVKMDEYVNMPLHIRDNILCIERKLMTIPEYSETYLLFLRPHLQDFFEWIFNYASSVSVWSAGDYHYVNAIVDLIFSDEQKNRLRFVWSRRHISPTFGQYLKPLGRVFRRYGDMNVHNTLLIDDKYMHHSKINDPMTMMPIHPFIPESGGGYSALRDRGLLDRMELLKEYIVYD